MITKQEIRERIIDQVQLKTVIHEEYASIEGNAIASEDENFDRKVCQEIRNQLEAGNPWAWCTVEVIARWETFSGNDFLGCCSYKDEDDFKQGGYAEGMAEIAVNDLIDSIISVNKSLEPLQARKG